MTDFIYTDFSRNLSPHPVSGDIVRFTEERAVMRSLTNILSTSRGERLYQPAIGSDLKNMLFEPMTSGMAQIIKQNIVSTVTDYEPRAKLIAVDVTPNFDNNLYIVTIVFMLINSSEQFTFNFTLERTR